MRWPPEAVAGSFEAAQVAGKGSPPALFCSGSSVRRSLPLSNPLRRLAGSVCPPGAARLQGGRNCASGVVSVLMGDLLKAGRESPAVGRWRGPGGRMEWRSGQALRGKAHRDAACGNAENRRLKMPMARRRIASDFSVLAWFLLPHGKCGVLMNPESSADASPQAQEISATRLIKKRIYLFVVLPIVVAG